MTMLCFMRQDRKDTLLTVYRFSGAKIADGDDCLQRLTRAVTEWVENTPDGKAAWAASAQDLNIGDIDHELTDCNSTLQRYLGRHGINAVNHVFTLANAQAVAYDRILANPKES